MNNNKNIVLAAASFTGIGALTLYYMLK